MSRLEPPPTGRNRERLLSLILRLYPASFLSQYREPMEQAFRDHLSHASTSRAFLAVLADTLRSAPRAHFHEWRSAMKFASFHIFALFAVMLLFLGRFELHTDDTGMVVFFVACFAFVLGYLRPALWWLWAMVGLCIPFAHIIVRPGYVAVQPHQKPLSPVDMVLIAAFVLAVGSTGSFLGSRLHRALNRPAA
jgi:cell division protein FtsW (lipid II flippase)